MRSVCIAAIVFVVSTFQMNAVRAADTPFFMFSAAQVGSDVGAVLAKYATPQDYLGQPVVRNNPPLANRLPSSHVYSLVPSLAGVARGCRSGAGMVIYDGEHWQSTPADEQSDMVSAVARGKAMATSGGCAYGVTPDGEYAGLIPKECGYDLSRAIHRQVDWSTIALFNVQAQRLLSDKCAAQGGVDAYVTFLTTIAQEVHAKNPQTLISAQFSFRYTPPSRMIEVIQRLRGTVNGFYIAYPSAVGRCDYCTPQNLAQVLAALR
jgi:hypothetical protein